MSGRVGSIVSANVPAAATISVIVVTHESGEVLDDCLGSLADAAPRRGIDAWVIDNASRDGTAAIASRHLPDARIVRLHDNRGFAAGVNAGLGRVEGSRVALINPDVTVPPGTLDRLADVLDRAPRAAVVAPRVRRPDGLAEASVGAFPSAARERNHALWLSRLPACQGRTRAFPARTAPVDWASGCAWLLRAEAVASVGPLDEGFFMYFDDVDYCRRLWQAGWMVLATPEAEVRHRTSRGSRITAGLPADGGLAAQRYFAKHLEPDECAGATRWLVRGWRLRALVRGAAGRFGHQPSARRAAQFRRAIGQVAGR